MNGPVSNQWRKEEGINFPLDIKENEKKIIMDPNGSFPSVPSDPDLPEIYRKKDIPLGMDFASFVTDNFDFRRVLSTTANMQILSMSLDPLGVENTSDDDFDRFIYIINGKVQVILNSEELFQMTVGCGMVIPAKTQFRMTALPIDNLSTHSVAKLLIVLSRPVFLDKSILKKNPILSKSNTQNNSNRPRSKTEVSSNPIFLGDNSSNNNVI